MKKVCVFFGHREVGEDLRKSLEYAVRRAIMDGCTIFWCGGKGNFDACAAEVVGRLKKEFPHIQLVLVLAYLPGKMALSKMYDEVIYPEGLETVPPRFAISHRNQWMVTHCDLVITYVNHRYGGAYAAYRSAKAKGKLLENLGALGI